MNTKELHAAMRQEKKRLVKELKAAFRSEGYAITSKESIAAGRRSDRARAAVQKFESAAEIDWIKFFK